LAVVDFEAAPGGDPRDAWVPVALEELLARRLRYVPGLLVVPTVRLYQGRNELQEPGAAPPPWVEVLRGLGAGYWLSGRCQGAGDAVSVELVLQPVGESVPTEQRVTIPAARLFETLDQATRWVLERLRITALEEAVTEQVFRLPSRSPSAVEYYARAFSAMRADKPRDALRYASQSLDSDKRFRPALALLAQLELQLGPSGRGSAGRRLRALADLARLENDALDRARAEIGQSLLLQVEGAFEAACTRAETALALAYEQRDVYGQLAAITAISDAYLLRPVPSTPELPPEARETLARQSLRHAADWQSELVEMLDRLGDLLGGLPAASKLALIYEQLEEPEQALKTHQRALAMANRLGSRRHQATAWLYLGQWYHDQQRWSEALDAVSRCLALADEQSKPPVRMALAAVYQAMNLHEEALAQYELAYEQVRKAEDLMSQFTCLREIASARMKLGRRELAIGTLQQAIDLAHVLELREEKRLREELETWKQGGT
jgi:tetratricopeptide (TPR) repeat protein